MAEAVAHTSGDEFAFELDDQPGSFIPLLKAIKDGRASKPGGPWDYDVSPNGLKIALWSTDPAASGAVLVVDDSGDDTSHAGLTPVRAVLPEGWNGWNADNTPDWDTSFVFPSEVERPLNLWHKHASTSGADGWFALVASERSFVFAAHNDQNGSHIGAFLW